VVNFMPWLLYPWDKSFLYPLDRWLGGPQSQSGHSGKKKKFYHYLCQELKLVIHPVAYSPY